MRLYLNGRAKVSLGVVIGVMTVIGMVWGGVQAVEYELSSTYASKKNFQEFRADTTKGLKQILEQIENMKCRSIREELNDISIKEENGTLTEYDIARKNDLELQWQRNCLGNGSGDS